jgi:uncharacterized glyoxalase superfamily protein PhnB
MKFASIRLVTSDIDRLVTFYTKLTGVAAARPTADFAQLNLPGAALAITTERAIRQFNAGAAEAAANRSAILEFQVKNVDGVYQHLDDVKAECVMPPTDQPWGNRSMLLRDPDGNLVNIFAPIDRIPEQ